MGFDETREFEVVEEVLHEFFTAEFEHKVVLTLAFVARLVAPASAAAPLRALDLVAADVVRVARMHHFPLTAGTVPERRLGNVLARNRDALGVLDILDAAIAYRFRNGATNVVLDATQKTLAIRNTLVLTS